MNEEEAKKWVKDKTNQNKTVKKFFEDYRPEKLKVAFFMAGIPGSGKTEFAQNTISDAAPELIPIEHDKLVEYIEGYKPENYYNFRKAGSALVTRIHKESLANGYGFIFDGTLSHENGVKNIKKTLAKDYRVIVVYIIQDARKAWELTKDREVVKKRAIEKDGFFDTCNKINANLLNIFKSFKDKDNFSFWIINKNGHPGMKDATSIIYNKDHIGNAKEVEKALNINYNLDSIK